MPTEPLLLPPVRDLRVDAHTRPCWSSSGPPSCRVDARRSGSCGRSRSCWAPGSPGPAPNDAGGDRVVEAERIADRPPRGRRPAACSSAERDRRELHLGRVDLDHGEVGREVLPNHLRRHGGCSCRSSPATSFAPETTSRSSRCSRSGQHKPGAGRLPVCWSESREAWRGLHRSWLDVGDARGRLLVDVADGEPASGPRRMPEAKPLTDESGAWRWITVWSCRSRPRRSSSTAPSTPHQPSEHSRKHVRPSVHDGRR